MRCGVVRLRFAPSAQGAGSGMGRGGSLLCACRGSVASGGSGGRSGSPCPAAARIVAVQLLWARCGRPLDAWVAVFTGVCGSGPWRCPAARLPGCPAARSSGRPVVVRCAVRSSVVRLWSGALSGCPPVQLSGRYPVVVRWAVRPGVACCVRLNGTGSGAGSGAGSGSGSGCWWSLHEVVYPT
jgi:hypothetical protein